MNGHENMMRGCFSDEIVSDFESWNSLNNVLVAYPGGVEPFFTDGVVSDHGGRACGPRSSSNIHSHRLLGYTQAGRSLRVQTSPPPERRGSRSRRVRRCLRL